MRRHTYKLSYRTIKENETVTLYWITSPETDSTSGAKSMTVFFKAGKELIPVEMPWGSLPLMKIGCDYKDGRMISKGAWPAQGEVVVKNNRNARIAKAYDCIPANLYSLLDASIKAGFEKCYRFQNNGVTYVIPCIELVRALYGDKRFFVDQILTSDGLEGLAIEETIDNKHLHIEFSKDYPKAEAKDSFVQEYAWLKYEPGILDGWKAVYNKFVSTKLITAEIPLKNTEILSYRGIRSGNLILILHAEFNNLSFPFDSITYSHPEFTEVDRETETSKSRSLGTEHPDEITLPDGSVTAKHGGTVFISEEPSKHFRFPPKRIERIVSATKRQASSKVFVKKEALEYTMQGKTGSGRRISVDLLPEDMVEPIASDPDFVEFCNAIGRIPYISKVASMDIEYGFFSGNTSFATMHGRGQRKYALATIIFSSGDSLSIVEACNTDGWSLSTLRIRSSSDTKALAKQMIENLNASDGHWARSWFGNSVDPRYLRLKHFCNRSAKQWAELLIQDKRTLPE